MVVTRAAAKGYFNTGDVPTETQFANFIDSGVFMQDYTALGTILYGAGAGTGVTALAMGSPLQSIRVNAGGTALEYYTPGSGSVTSISIASANGFAGSSSGGATPALTISTTITGILKGNGTAISAASAGTDYVIPSVTTLSSLTSIGTVTTGIWNASVIAPAYGGTGIANNAASTVTITGAFGITWTVTNTTALTLPTSGTLMNNTLASANMYVGSASNVATGVLMSQDATMINTGAVTVVWANGYTTYDARYLKLAGGTLIGALVLNADPVTALGAATKQYVDATIAGLQIKQTATVATAAALPTNTYLAGVITVTATGTLTVDSYVVALNDYVLVKNEASALKNGLYLCTTAGAVGVQAVLTRATDMDSASEFSGAFIPVSYQGTLNANSLWLCNPVGAVTVGVTSIPFTQLNGATDIIAGTGIGISGNTISIDSTVVTLAGAQALINKTYNGNTWTAGTGVLTISPGIVLTATDSTTLASHSITFASGEILTLTATKNVTFADAFTTSGAFALTLTSTATSNATIPAGTNILYSTKSGSITSAQLLASLTDETGTGVAVFNSTPTLVTPILGVATATSINKVTITAPATSSTLTIADGKTLTANDTTVIGTNSITFAGTEVLTLASTKSVTFADAFVTSGAFSITLTAIQTSNMTLQGDGTVVALIYNTATDVSHTGDTTDTLAYSYPCPANSLNIADELEWISKFRRTGSGGATEFRYWINTSNSLSGATQVAVSSGNSSTLFQYITRSLSVKTSTTLEVSLSSQNIVTDSGAVSTNAVSTITIDRTAIIYFIISIKCTNSADTGILSRSLMRRNRM